jgi:hypothetical protein
MDFMGSSIHKFNTKQWHSQNMTFYVILILNCRLKSNSNYSFAQFHHNVKYFKVSSIIILRILQLMTIFQKLDHEMQNPNYFSFKMIQVNQTLRKRIDSCTRQIMDRS